MPPVILIAIIGTHATGGQIVDLFWQVVMPVLGYVTVKLNIPRVALMLAFVIAPTFESSMNQPLIVANGNPGYVFGRSISVAILEIIVAAVVVPSVLRYRAHRQHRSRALDIGADAS